MAVGNPYGQLAYGAGPYARYGSSRPYGVGAYGTAVYGGWGVNTFDVGGVTALRFAATADAHITYQPHATTAIVWNVIAYNPQVEMHPEAISGIVFSAWTFLEWSWAATPPCEAGTWTPAAPCEGGAWTPTTPCVPGNWTVVRLL